jgi:hypothetical protein
MAFKRVCGIAVRPANDWHTNCFEKIRKEKVNENQDEFEGWWRLIHELRRSEVRVYDSKAVTGNPSVRLSNGTGLGYQPRKEQGNENQDECESWFWSERKHKLFVRRCGVDV